MLETAKNDRPNWTHFDFLIKILDKNVHHTYLFIKIDR